MSDTPFILHGGGTEQAAIINRINAISRIQNLSGVDLRTKSKYFLFALDMEMYQRWYKDYPKDHVIDEGWCQRAAEVVKTMDKDTSNYDKATELAGVVRQAYTESQILPLTVSNSSRGRVVSVRNLPLKEPLFDSTGSLKVLVDKFLGKKKSFWQKIKERIES